MDNTAKGYAQQIVSELKRIVRGLDLLTNAPGQDNQKPLREHDVTDATVPVVSKRPSLASLPWKGIGEGVAILIALGVGFLNYIQWKDLRHNFESEQRAWIKVDVDWSNFPASHQLKVHLSNIGKSAATQLTEISVIEVVPSAQDPSFKWRGLPHHNVFIPLVFPGDKTETGPLPLFTSEIRARRLAEDELRSLSVGESYMAIFGFVVYSDQFGKHWTEFCNWSGFEDSAHQERTFHARACAERNLVGEGEPPD